MAALSTLERIRQVLLVGSRAHGDANEVADALAAAGLGDDLIATSQAAEKALRGAILELNAEPPHRHQLGTPEEVRRWDTT